MGVTYGRMPSSASEQAGPGRYRASALPAVTFLAVRLNLNVAANGVGVILEVGGVLQDAVLGFLGIGLHLGVGIGILDGGDLLGAFIRAAAPAAAPCRISGKSRES
jgi:hypothetical protein